MNHGGVPCDGGIFASFESRVSGGDVIRKSIANSNALEVRMTNGAMFFPAGASWVREVEYGCECNRSSIVES